MSELIFDGYAEDIDGLSRVELYEDGLFVNVWQSGDLRDDIESLADFIQEFGEELYISRDDYKAGTPVDVRDIWPEWAQ